MGSFRIDTSYAYQSQGTSFSDWISLITLCLAPLIAHLIGGVPTPTYLCGSRPHWHDCITHYNPTSILWRYFAITDRRLRTRSWKSADLAATNALFWTVNGWDGSEEMAQRTRTHRIPGSSRTHVEPLSGSTLKTIAVTLQGVQAIYVIVWGATADGTFGNYLALDTIFFPIAIFGLLRLPAALWLSDEKLYHSIDPATQISDQTFPPLLNRLHIGSEPLDLSQEAIMSRYHSSGCLRGVLVRGTWILVIAGLLTVTLLQMPLGSSGLTLNLTAFAVLLLYLLFLSVTLIVLSSSMLRGSKTTVVPCITQKWYKLYTIILFLWMFAVFVIAALGTRRTPCGRSTTWSLGADSAPGLCPYSVHVSASSTRGVWSGLLGRSKNGTLVVGRFDGWCQAKSRWLTVNATENNIFE
jgi:hypothetical protein